MRREGAVGDQTHAVGMRNVILQQLAARGGVDGHGHRADLSEREVEQQLLGAVLQHHRHMLALLDAEREQVVGDDARQPVRLLVAVGAPVRDVMQVGAIAVFPGLRFENVADGEVGDGEAHALFGGGGRVRRVLRRAGGHEGRIGN